MAFAKLLAPMLALGASALLACACSSSDSRPRVDGALPAVARPGSSTFVIIQGDRFARKAEARVGSSRLAHVTWVNARMLTAELPGGMKPGRYDLTISNPGGGEARLGSAITVPATSPSPGAAAATAPPSPSPAPGPTGRAAPPTRAPTARPSAPAIQIPNLAGPWSIVDTVTFGPGAGKSFSFRVVFTQQGDQISGQGDGIRLNGAIDGRRVRASYVQEGGATGTFDWTVDAGDLTFRGSFTNSIGNGGDSVGQRVSGVANPVKPAPAEQGEEHEERDHGKRKGR